MYKFPKITHIDDILNAIEGKDEFILVDKGDYKVVNYVYNTDDTFPIVENNKAALLRECRGIMFDMDGQVIRRPYHKFFNINERPETLQDDIDFNQHHYILEKLDGSMVTPFITNWTNYGEGEGDIGSIRWATKMGETDISAQAQAYLKSVKKISYEYFAAEVISNDSTPIFEWCSRQNRVVIDHEEDKLVLTAIRNNWNGMYWPLSAMQAIADAHAVPVVKVFDMSANDIDSFISHTRNLVNMEGYVIRFDDGHMLKVKADWYMRIHSFKNLISSESNVVNIIINGQLDDVISIPDILEDDKIRVQKYAKEFWKVLQAEAQELGACLAALHTEGVSRKDFALKNIMKPLNRSLVFTLWDKDMAKTDKMTVMNAIATIIKKGSTNNKSFAKVKDEFFKELVYA